MMDYPCAKFSDFSFSRCQHAFVVSPLQIDRWCITLWIGNTLSVAIGTVKQKCLQVAFEHVSRAQCGLQVNQQPIPSSRKGAATEKAWLLNRLLVRRTVQSPFEVQCIVTTDGTSLASMSMLAMYADELWTSRHNL